MSMDKWPEVMNQAKDVGIDKIFLTGGEPFLLDIRKLIQYASERQMRIVGVETNGISLDKTAIDALSVHNTTFHVSFDDIHGRLKSVERNIKDLINSGFNVIINSVITKSETDYIVDLYERIKSLSITGWRLMTPTKIGRAEDLNILLVGDEADVYRIIMERWLMDGRPFQLSLGSLMTNRGNRICSKHVPRYVCEYFHSVVTMMPDGRLLPCCRFIIHPKVMDDSRTIFEKSMKEQIERSALLRIKNRTISDIVSLPENVECQTCQLLDFCQLGCSLNSFIEGGNMDIHETRHCQMMKQNYSGFFREYDCINNDREG